MPAYQLLRFKPQEDTEQLFAQLEAELAACSEVDACYRNKVKAFMVENGIWHISELDYPWRQEFRKFLEGQVKPKCFYGYEKAFDKVKQYSIQRQRRWSDNSRVQPKYENKILFLLYHPDQALVKRLNKAQRKEELVWDFEIAAPERMKRQIFQMLHHLLKQDENRETLRVHMDALRHFYDFCIKKGIEDIEKMEQSQLEDLTDNLKAKWKKEKALQMVELCRKTLFLEAAEIHWDAHIWYLERFHFQPERLDPAKPVMSISFLEVAHRRNRELLKKYMRYGLGITNLAIHSLCHEMLNVRNFLAELVQEDDADVCSVTSKQMDVYFRQLEEKEIQAESYNKQIMSILHFFNFLQVHRYIEKLPFHADYYLKKNIPQHHDRSVEWEVSCEILQKLHNFPEKIRLMYLHLWCLGLRISEVCTLKGNAYYIQGRDAWIQVYQIKMKSYKRIPIPNALYQLMKVYLKKYRIGPRDYVFQNKRGGAYVSNTFRKRMLECCAESNIQNGMYAFKSHDYRHSIATLLYDNGVSRQSVRDYLGHAYEEMTLQYIDYMPRKLAKANEEYFSQHNSLAAALKKEKR